MFKEILDDGISFLAKEQQKDGSFVTITSTDPLQFNDRNTIPAVFTTSLVLHALHGLPQTATVNHIKEKAANYLLKQKSSNWSFNYWARDSKEYSLRPYPDDLDDTFLSLSALYEYRKSMFDGKVFAKIIALLTTAEKEEGGPYRTWLVTDDSPEVWKDVDLVVNSNIAYFLFLQEIELPKLLRFIETAIQSGKLSSPYYYSQIPVIYFISQFYQGRYKKKLVSQIINTEQILTPLQCALIALSLLNLDSNTDNALKYLNSLVEYQTKGKWEPYAFYIDLAMKDKKHYAGSAALTTSYCLLALATYSRNTGEKVKTYKRTNNTLINNLHLEVIARVEKRYAGFDKSLQKEIHHMIIETTREDKAHQITLLPYYIANSLERKNEFTKDFILQLGSASLYGWLAYSFYDNFLDEEGDPKTLPSANIALREMITIFTNILQGNLEFINFFNKIIDTMEAANNWEVHNCRSTKRIPDYKNYSYLADRSIGHALAPAALLFKLGYTTKSHEVKMLLKFFKHYIIARQLNDDAHDIETDFKKGHINAAAANVLRSLQKKDKTIFSKPALLQKEMHEHFWKEEVVHVCHDILSHTKMARKTVAANPVIKDNLVYEKMLLSIERSAKTALEEHENVMKFMKEFTKK